LVLASLVSRHYKIRLAECFDLSEEPTAAGIDDQTTRSIEMIGDVLRSRSTQRKPRRTKKQGSGT
jgi:hypothetical protein